MSMSLSADRHRPARCSPRVIAGVIVATLTVLIGGAVPVAAEEADTPTSESASSAVSSLTRTQRDSACVGADSSTVPNSFSYLTCVSRPDGTLLLLADPLIDANLDLVSTATSVNDSRSLSLTDGAIAFGGTCIVGFTPLGTSDTDSTSAPQGTSSTTRGDGTLPVTMVELAHVSVPTEPGERPTAGAAVGFATTPDGKARSSGTVTRDDADSETETADEGIGEDISVHSEDALEDTDDPVGTSLLSEDEGLVPTG